MNVRRRARCGTQGWVWHLASWVWVGQKCLMQRTRGTQRMQSSPSANISEIRQSSVKSANHQFILTGLGSIDSKGFKSIQMISNQFKPLFKKNYEIMNLISPHKCVPHPSSPRLRRDRRAIGCRRTVIRSKWCGSRIWTMRMVSCDQRSCGSQTRAPRAGQGVERQGPLASISLH